MAFIFPINHEKKKENRPQFLPSEAFSLLARSQGACASLDTPHPVALGAALPTGICKGEWVSGQHLGLFSVGQVWTSRGCCSGALGW